MKLFMRALVAAAALGVAGTANAYSVSPLRMTLEPVGPAAAGRLQIDNTEAQPITLAMETLAVDVAQDGGVTRRSAGSDLTLFPPQALLQPGKSQNLQVRYTGAPVDAPKLYNVHVTQVPILATQGRAQIKVAMEFYVAVVVEPEGAQPDLQLKSSSKEPDGNWTLQIANEGTGMGRLNSAEWVATTSSGTVPVPVKALSFGETGYIMPGTTRAVTLNMEEVSELGEITGLSIVAAE